MLPANPLPEAHRAPPNEEDALWLRRHHRQTAFTWGLLAVALAGMLGVSFVTSTRDIESGKVWLSPTCPSKKFFGKECPTCGMTRGFCALSHGQWEDALKYNRGAPLFYLLAWFGVGWSTWGVVKSLREARRAAPTGTSP